MVNRMPSQVPSQMREGAGAAKGRRLTRQQPAWRQGAKSGWRVRELVAWVGAAMLLNVDVSVSVRTHRVKVLGCIHSPEQHAHMALEHDSVRAVNLQYAGNSKLLLPVCIQ